MKALQFLPLLMILTFLTFSCTKEDEDTGQAQQQHSAMIALESGSTSKIGNLDQGMVLSSLDWAWNNSIDCFVSHAAHRYAGKHVFYTTQLPASSKMKVNLIPDDPKSKMAVYSYGSFSETVTLPQDLASCWTCQADPREGSSEAGTRSIELQTVQVFDDLPQSTHTVVIGVAGADGVLSGGYTLEVQIDS